jgi:hypothetical protein
MAKINIDDLVDIAFAVEEGDPIDWDRLKQGREQAMKMVAATILEQFDHEEFTDEHRMIVMATITKLVVENMILHSKLLTFEQNNQ